MDSQRQQVSESIWRMGLLQSVVRAWPASTTLFCVLVVLQILHARRNRHEAPRAMSTTMLVALSLGCVVLDLILSHWVLSLVTFVYMFSYPEGPLDNLKHAGTQKTEQEYALRMVCLFPFTRAAKHMAPPPSNPRHCARQACFVFLLLSAIAALAAAAPSSYSSHCSSLLPAADRHTDVCDDVELLLSSIHLPNGFISGAGADSLFSPDSGVLNDRSFSLIPTGVSRTADPALIHLTATLTLFGYRVHTYEYKGHTGREMRDHTIFFHLDGYSSASAELCMVGAGTEHAAVAGSVKHYADVALHLRVPSPPSLTDPFVAGRLDGADFEPVSLVTYAEGNVYKYSERASCPPTATARRALQPQNSSFSCSALRARLVTKYRLEYGSTHASNGASLLPWLREPRMNVNRVRCATNGAVRVYAAFSNDTSLWTPWGFSVEEQAVVADGFWDSATSRLCLSACRVVRSGGAPSATENLEARECGIGMSFWFPAVWTAHDRSVAAGMLWDASQTATANSHGVISSLITASSLTKGIRGNLSDVRYKYNRTMLETAKQHYLKAGLMSIDKKSKQGFFSKQLQLLFPALEEQI
ncbi:hypothetical protein BAE44_0020296 [Dichanthelium oligosanthes]|uniref:DUF2921 domain-containing protein n=1 Tax=Dichanthelium oligosanthes TaxID=888268 RepID=A0A1E5V0K2_9POAL|nr:hypothetical protein BAE44_0020296 [Dichanthelium oligosanthes]